MSDVARSVSAGRESGRIVRADELDLAAVTAREVAQPLPVGEAREQSCIPPDDAVR